MPDQPSESSKPSFPLRAGLAAFLSTVFIAVAQKSFKGDTKSLEFALLVSPFLGQMTSEAISIPIQYAFDTVDLFRYGRHIDDLIKERGQPRTTDARKIEIESELAYFQKECFRLRAKSIIR